MAPVFVATAALGKPCPFFSQLAVIPAPEERYVGMLLPEDGPSA